VRKPKATIWSRARSVALLDRRGREPARTCGRRAPAPGLWTSEWTNRDRLFSFFFFFFFSTLDTPLSSSSFHLPSPPFYFFLLMFLLSYHLPTRWVTTFCYPVHFTIPPSRAFRQTPSLFPSLTPYLPLFHSSQSHPFIHFRERRFRHDAIN